MIVANIQVGDQIMDINGNSFLDIGHQDAAKLLRSSKHLMMTVKDVGKLPHTRTTYDQTQWIVEQRSASRNHSTKSAPATPRYDCVMDESTIDILSINISISTVFVYVLLIKPHSDKIFSASSTRNPTPG